MNKEDFYREEREHESRIDAYYERQEIRRQQELSRQRARNGGYTDEELMHEIEPYDEYEDVKPKRDDWENEIW